MDELSTDVELMENVRDGDLRQLAPLFERHHLRLYNFYLRLTGDRHLSEDLVQEVFFRMLKYRHTFKGVGEFTAWMYFLARNVRKDQYKKWRNETNVTGKHEELAEPDPAGQEQLEQKQEGELLQQALAKLPFDKKEILILSRYQELKYETIAEILGCSADAVKVRVHRAMKELKEIFFQLSGEKANG